MDEGLTAAGQLTASGHFLNRSLPANRACNHPPRIGSMHNAAGSTRALKENVAANTTSQSNLDDCLGSVDFSTGLVDTKEGLKNVCVS